MNAISKPLSDALMRLLEQEWMTFGEDAVLAVEAWVTGKRALIPTKAEEVQAVTDAVEAQAEVALHK